MNNQDFRALLDSTRAPNPTSSSQASSNTTTTKPKPAFSLTPRSVSSTYHKDFKRISQDTSDQPVPKKFKSNAAPKGTKLAAGYVDRAKLRADAATAEDERATKIADLEQQLKQGSLTRAQFEQARDAITQGDVGSMHLVKGLDRQLLERVRKGEDIFSAAAPPPPPREASPDPDAAFDALEAKQVTAIVREREEKKGELAPVPQKRSRNDLLKELRAQRDAAAAAAKAAQPALGGRFRKIGEQKAGPTPGSRIEIDEKGREVLITVDEAGNVKRKVRKTPKVESLALPAPDPENEPLGMAVPAQAPTAPEASEDEDIFAGVGDDYNPLGHPADDDDDDDDDDIDEAVSADDDDDESTPAPAEQSTEQKATAPATKDPPTRPRQNYFSTTSPDRPASPPPPSNPINDPTILAALRRAAAERKAEADKLQAEQEQAQQRLKQRQDRDFEDIDMGLSSSRVGGGDDDDDDGDGVRLSEWGGDEQGKAKKRKRAPKKRKGDKNSAADVLRVMAARESKDK